MDWDDIKDTVGKYAPLAGTLLGGPQGTAIGSLISSALGVGNSPEEVNQVLNDPEHAEKLRRFEADNHYRLKELQFKQLDRELDDKASARENHSDSKMPAVITIALTLFAAMIGLALFTVEIPDKNRDMVNYFMGQQISLWVASVVYWVGTTRSSSDKNKWLSKIKLRN